MDSGLKQDAALTPGEVCGKTPVINLKFVRAKESVKLQQGFLPFAKESPSQPRLPLSLLVPAGMESTGVRLLESNVEGRGMNPANSPAAAVPMSGAVKSIVTVVPDTTTPLPVGVAKKSTTGEPTSNSLKDAAPLVGVTVEETSLDGAPSPVGHDPASISKEVLGNDTMVHSKDVMPKLSKKDREDQRVERERVKAEAKAKREEERLKREHEKQLREQEKKERRIKREQEAIERQEKREREELEKKERREKREAEKRKKDEEKQKKLEEKRKLEREKEQREEEKLRREQQAKMKFRGYFGKPEKPTVTKQEKASDETVLTEFSMKDGMSLARTPREPLQSMSEFDNLVALQDPSFTSDYIHTCKSVSRKQTEKAPEELDDSLILISDSRKQTLPKFKLLQFRENYRPSYYGSWRRARGSITPRNPLRKDKNLFDYEVDSDDEWEEEEPGESLSSSEGDEKDGDAAEDSDEDDGFFVPHGYLSNDEGDCSDSGEFMTDPNEDRSESKRRKQLAKAWEAEFARKCQPLEARIVGCIWLTGGPEKDFSDPDSSFLMQFAAVPLVPLPISAAPIATEGETSAQKGESQGGACSSVEPQKHSVPEEAMPDLIRFLHKSALSKKKIIRAFQIHWGAKNSVITSSHETPVSQSPGVVDSTPRPLPKSDSTPKSTNNNEYQEYETASNISKYQMKKKIQAIAVKEIRPPIVKLVWYVHDSVLKQYGLEQENFAPLVSNGSPCLGAKPPDQTPSRTSSTPETPFQPKASKRKAGGTGKSLLHFLSRSPVGKTETSSRPRHPKGGTSVSPPPLNGEVIILDPPVPGDELAEPPAKRQATGVHGNKTDQDVIVLDPPDAAGNGLGQPPAEEGTGAVSDVVAVASIVNQEPPNFVALSKGLGELSAGKGTAAVSEELGEPPAKKPCLETTVVSDNNGATRGVASSTADQNVTLIMQRS